jgi:hypothetical protein
MNIEDHPLRRRLADSQSAHSNKRLVFRGMAQSCFGDNVMIVPVYLPYYVLAGAIGVVAALLFGLRSALGNAGWTAYDRTVTARAATITVIGWFFLAIALALSDAYRGAADRIPTIQYGILVPILIGGLLIWRSPRVARIIDAVPQHWLVGAQLYRTLGVIFLILYAGGKLPGYSPGRLVLAMSLSAFSRRSSRLRIGVGRARMPIWSSGGTYLALPISSSTRL